MNTYLIYTQSGAAYVVRATYSFEAEARRIAGGPPICPGAWWSSVNALLG